MKGPSGYIFVHKVYLSAGFDCFESIHFSNTHDDDVGIAGYNILRAFCAGLKLEKKSKLAKQTRESKKIAAGEKRFEHMYLLFIQ